jgi:hypothetical protein
MIYFYGLNMIYIIVPGTGSNTFWESMYRKYNALELFKMVSVGSEPASIASKEIDKITEPRHYRAIRARECRAVKKDMWDNSEKIGFIRHPYDWSWSIYNKGLIMASMIGVDNFGTYTHFLETLHITPYDWLTDESGNIIVDKVYRTEDLSEVLFHYGGVSDKPQNVTGKPRRELTEYEDQILREKFHREFTHYK